MLTNLLLRELDERGFMADCTDQIGLEARLGEGPTRIYIGFDPTADSLHVGSLMPLAVARILQRHGHVPVLLVGGATGMIGDPSGRSSERNLLDDATLDHNRAALQRQIERLVPAENGETLVVDNRDWIGPMTAIELLRDVGRHFPVNAMLSKDSVRLRRDNESGLTFTEFAYQILQAFDFWWLRANLDVEVQMGGSDQWGNITAGTDFMRRRDGSTGFGLVWPLLMKADSSKFGKSSDGNVWLDANKTRPFDFWQFWFNTDDADVETMLLRFSRLSPHDVRGVMVDHQRDHSKRTAQRVLADDVTTWVHGSAMAKDVAAVAAVVFGGSEVLSAEWVEAVGAHLGALRLHADDLLGAPFVEVAVRAGLCASNNDARRVAAAGGLRARGRQVGPEEVIDTADIADGWLLLRRGRRQPALVTVGDAR